LKGFAGKGPPAHLAGKSKIKTDTLQTAINAPQSKRAALLASHTKTSLSFPLASTVAIAKPLP